MRILPIILALCLAFRATSAFAQLGAPYRPSQGFQPTWTVGAQTYGPTLTGHFQGIQDGQPILVDLDSDLGLGKDKTTPGFFLDYQGTSYGFQLSSGSAEYRGDRTVSRAITVNGQTYAANSRVQSHVKLASVDGVWTIKFAQDADTWLGFDLGAQVWTVDLDATDAPLAPATARTASTQVKAPIPQLGLSGGSRAFNGAMEAKAYIHYLPYKRSKYTLYGVDLRVFPVSWFGLRAFYEGGRFDVPKGSIKDDLEFQLDRKGAGLGAVLRF
ncbi:MAG: hypothetical protein HY014_03665 [Acidobacteria bacterium]|nr:hypothetical protein [Acidobacteriota bacterium]MBI3487250.1 hypothetical protein [Acidobacteriota bacterium]